MSLLFLSLLSIVQAKPSWPDISQPISNIGYQTSKDSALIIAIEDYSNISDVRGATQNGRDWQAFFLKSGSIPASRVRLIENKYAFQAEILRHAKELSAETPAGGKIWLIYIGHGASDGKNPIFLDVNAIGVASSFESQLKQKDLIGVLKEKHDVIAIIDACFSGSDNQGVAFLTDTQFAAPTSLLEMPQATILTAAKHNEFAGSIDGLERPAFSYLTLGGMRGWADQNGDGVSLNELVQYSKETLQATIMGRSQTPTLTGDGNVIVSKGREDAPYIEKKVSYQEPVISDRVTVTGGDFSFEVVQKSKSASEKIDKVLDEAENSLQRKAEQQWNHADFVSLRKSDVETAKQVVRQFLSSYIGVIVEYPEEIQTPVDIPLKRSVHIKEIEQAREWLSEHGETYYLEGKGYRASLIPAGTFTMGCTSEQGSDCGDDEKPVHKVTISKDFYMMESEVTQALYESVMRSKPSHVKDANRPVENVSWYDAVNFANKLSALEGREQCYQINGENVSWNNKDCKGWRLPTEAEWEYAARGGQSYKYAGSNSVDEVGWNNEDFARGHHDVCGKTKNGYGLCDMSGNVWEWVFDWYGDYSTENQSNPQGKSTGSYRVVRGGGWGDSPEYLQVSSRFGISPGNRSFSLGFRLELLP